MQKSFLDDAVRAIADKQDVVESKVGDLIGVNIYKFKMSQQICLLAYRVLDSNTIKVLMVGPYENFYRVLKHISE